MKNLVKYLTESHYDHDKVNTSDFEKLCELFGIKNPLSADNIETIAMQIKDDADMKKALKTRKLKFDESTLKDFLSSHSHIEDIELRAYNNGNGTNTILIQIYAKTWNTTEVFAIGSISDELDDICDKLKAKGWTKSMDYFKSTFLND